MVRTLDLDIGLTSAVYGTLGTIYAVLIAFVVSGVWQSFSSAGSAVSSEANALTDLVFIIGQLPAERSGKTRDLAKAYVQSVVDRWDALVQATMDAYAGRGDHAGHFVGAGAGDHGDRAGEIAASMSLYAQALDLTAIWLDASRDRLRSAKGNTAKALWGLLIAGAFVLFAFHGMFVTHVWAVWAGLLLGFSLIVGLAFYLIFSLDSPFTGKLSAGPEPFLWLLNTFHRADGPKK